MILKLPRDYRCYNCYKRLVSLVQYDERLANAIFMQLWTDLGYQVEVHGRSGRIQKSEAEHFDRAVNYPGAFVLLLESQTLVPSNEDEYLCPIFELNNRELDRDFIPSGAKGRMITNFNKKLQKHTVKAFDYVGKMPEQCWILEDGVTRILQFEMNRCILLIKMIDNLLGQDRRQFNHYTPPLLQAAQFIVSRWSDDKLHVILRRLFFMRGTIKDLPRTTADALRRWDDLVWKVMPDEGYVKWSKPESNETES